MNNPGNKQALLLLHGALGSQKQFDKLRKLLSEIFDVHSLDFSGHGGKDIVKKYSIEQFVNDVLTYVNDHQLASPLVFGYSMGGYVALRLAAEHPEVLGRILTLGTKLEWNEETAGKEAGMLNAENIEEKVPAFAKRLEMLHAPVNWKEVVAETRDLLLGLGKHPALEDGHISQIQNKVVIGLGSDDNMVSKKESKRVAALLPNGSFKLIKGFKHPIDMVDPEKLARVIAESLKE